MNHAIKNAISVGPRSMSCCFASISSFHSTAALEWNRRSSWNRGRAGQKAKRSNCYVRRNRGISKKPLFKDISDFADIIFQSWRDDDDMAWFRKQFGSKGAKSNGFGFNESQWGRYKNQTRANFHFWRTDGDYDDDDDDDDDIETIFRASCGNHRYYWSSGSSEDFQWRNHFGRGNRTNSWNWRYETDEEYDSPPESELASERLALGLKAAGPLKLEEIKDAYRACALQWHPDRHQGASKAVAEEKFKHCSAAYKSLCDKLAVQ